MGCSPEKLHDERCCSTELDIDSDMHDIEQCCSTELDIDSDMHVVEQCYSTELYIC